MTKKRGNVKRDRVKSQPATLFALSLFLTLSNMAGTGGCGGSSGTGTATQGDTAAVACLTAGFSSFDLGVETTSLSLAGKRSQLVNLLKKTISVSKGGSCDEGSIPSPTGTLFSETLNGTDFTPSGSGSCSVTADSTETGKSILMSCLDMNGGAGTGGATINGKIGLTGSVSDSATTIQVGSQSLTMTFEDGTECTVLLDLTSTLSGGTASVSGCLSVCGTVFTLTGDEAVSTTTDQERLYIGTGEYDAAKDWDGILRFEDSQLLNGETGDPVTPDATIPAGETTDSSGVKLNFIHGMYLWESRDEMFVSTLFTNASNSVDRSIGNPTVQNGSIGVISSISSADGAQVLSRHIFGSQTQLWQPHGIWVDESRDILYVANTFGYDILVFDNASTVNGNVAPDRTIDNAKLGGPVFLYVDEENDRLFIASVSDPTNSAAGNPSIVIYNNASTLNGDVAPAARIVGSNTRLNAGNNQTTHNVWFNSLTNQLFVGHHTNEVLIYDLSSTDLDPTSSTDYNLTPRVLKVNEQSDDSDAGSWSAYGLFLIPEEDRLFVSCGFTSGGPALNSPPNEIKIFDGVSDSSFSGVQTPTRTIHWDSGATYFPPQPLWIQRY